MAVKIKYSRKFDKHYNKRIVCKPKLDARFHQRLAMFVENPRNLVLRDHPLKGSKAGLRSFSITGDVRVIYSAERKGEITLVDIGSHNQVY